MCTVWWSETNVPDNSNAAGVTKGRATLHATAMQPNGLQHQGLAWPSISFPCPASGNLTTMVAPVKPLCVHRKHTLKNRTGAARALRMPTLCAGHTVRRAVHPQCTHKRFGDREDFGTVALRKYRSSLEVSDTGLGLHHHDGYLCLWRPVTRQSTACTPSFWRWCSMRGAAHWDHAPASCAALRKLDALGTQEPILAHAPRRP